MRRELTVSTRRLYSAFPGGIAEICKQAGIPAPSQRLKTVQKGLEARAKRGVDEGAGEGDHAARSSTFSRRDTTAAGGHRLRIAPDLVEELYDKWLALKEVDVNQPAVLKGLRALQDLAEAGYSLCKTTSQILYALDAYTPLLLQSQRNSFHEELNKIMKDNNKTIGAVIKAYKGFNPSLRAFLLEKSLETLAYGSLGEFTEDNGFGELGIDVSDLKDPWG